LRVVGLRITLLHFLATFASLAFDQSRAKVVPTLWAWDQRAINFWFYFSKTGKSCHGNESEVGQRRIIIYKNKKRNNAHQIAKI
jgi:hypothetical protein